MQRLGGSGRRTGVTVLMQAGATLRVLLLHPPATGHPLTLGVKEPIGVTATCRRAAPASAPGFPDPATKLATKSNMFSASLYFFKFELSERNLYCVSNSCYSSRKRSLRLNRASGYANFNLKT